jgi:hypothetical protein
MNAAYRAWAGYPLDTSAHTHPPHIPRRGGTAIVTVCRSSTHRQARRSQAEFNGPENVQSCAT